MLRFCLTVIFSFLVSHAEGQHVVRLFAGPDWLGATPAVVHFRDNFPNGTYEVRGVGGLEYSGQGVSGNQYVVENPSAYNALLQGGETTGAWRRLDVSGTNPYTGVAWTNWQGNTNYFPPPVVDETIDVEWKFTSEWAGSVVEVVDSQGNVIATYALPAVIGPEGYTLEATISAPDLEGAQVYLDGVPTNSLAALAASELVTEELDRPGYAFNFDGSYSGSSWEIRRPDGGIAASGSAASLQTVLEGRVTIGGGDEGEVFVLTPSGDGMPSQWISTGVTVQGSTITVHAFVNNPAAAAPEPMPTPAPVSTPAASQPAPTNQTTSPPSVLNPTNSEDYFSVDVEPVELEDPDDGEENVLNTIGELQGLVSGIVADMAQVQGNFVEASQVFNGLRLGGVGRNCQFSIGPASITLQTSGTVRSGLTLLMIGLAAFGAASMIRTAIQ